MRFSASTLDLHEQHLGYTPFLAACGSTFDPYGHKLAAMRLLLAHGADAKAKCENFGNTALHLVLMASQDNVHLGRTVLRATERSLQAALELVLQAGADFQAPNEVG